MTQPPLIRLMAKARKSWRPRIVAAAARAESEGQGALQLDGKMIDAPIVVRARSVLVLLTGPLDKEGGGLKASQWSASGYADTDPVSTNETDEGRKKNRRVELVVQPDVEEMLNLKSLAR